MCHLGTYQQPASLFLKIVPVVEGDLWLFGFSSFPMEDMVDLFLPSVVKNLALLFGVWMTMRK